MTIADIVRELGIPTAPEGHHHVSEGWIGIDCPHCSHGTQRFRMGIPTDNPRVASCWTCGSHRLWESLSLASGVRVGLVGALFGTLTQDFAPESTLGAGKLVLPAHRGPLRAAHKQYLTKRGLDPDEIVRLWHIEGIPTASRLSWRIFIPIQLNAETVSWTTRTISRFKYITPYLTAKPEEEKTHHRELLYGEDLCRHCIVVNEGPLDAWAIGPGAVATLGVGYSKAQVLRMSKYPVRVILFDNEPEAQRRARELCNDLAVFDGETSNVVLETGKDAVRASKKEIQQLRQRFLT